MTNPINLQIRRADNTWDIIEVVPLLIEEGRELIFTGTFQLYRGYPEFDSHHFCCGGIAGALDGKHLPDGRR